MAEKTGADSYFDARNKKLEKQVLDPNPNSHQIGGEHYREANKNYQHWDLVADYGMNYFIGNMTKYVCRWRKKGGVKDLEKAKHYLEKLIDLERGGYADPPARSRELDDATKFCDDQQLAPPEREIIIKAITYWTVPDLLFIHAELEKLIREA